MTQVRNLQQTGAAPSHVTGVFGGQEMTKHSLARRTGKSEVGGLQSWFDSGG